jgi:hypothetical protein
MKAAVFPANHKALDLVRNVLQRLPLVLQSWKFVYAEEGSFTINN